MTDQPFCRSTGKRSYESSLAARKAGRAIRMRRPKGKGRVAGASLETYRCLACGLFHLGRARQVGKRGATA